MSLGSGRGQVRVEECSRAREGTFLGLGTSELSLAEHSLFRVLLREHTRVESPWLPACSSSVSVLSCEHSVLPVISWSSGPVGVLWALLGRVLVLTLPTVSAPVSELLSVVMFAVISVVVAKLPGLGHI